MTTTINRGYSTPATGANPGTWGEVDLNPNFVAIDNNLGGVASIALTNTAVVLSPSQYQCGTIRFSGALTGAILITFPAVQGWWSIENLTTGAPFILLTCGAGNNISIPQGRVTDILTDGTNVKFRNLGIDIGDYWDYAGSTVPVWVTACTVPPYLLCDGSTFSAVTYPYLNSILGTNTLPDLRGRSRFNLNGGTSRITTAGSGIDGNTRFSAGGAQSVTLDTTMIPSHTHPGTTASSGLHNHTVFGNSASTGPGGGMTPASASGNQNTTPGTSTDGAHTHTFTTDATGGGLAHQNMPPALISGITMIRAA